MKNGDFTANAHLLWLAGLAIIVGGLCAFVAVALLWQIGLFTHLFYYPVDLFTTLTHHPLARIAFAVTEFRKRLKRF
jgi:membrane protein implicated in regulation of membrane protease activity